MCWKLIFNFCKSVVTFIKGFFWVSCIFLFGLVISCGRLNFQILHFKISSSSEARKYYSLAPCRNTVYHWRNTSSTTSFFFLCVPYVACRYFCLKPKVHSMQTPVFHTLSNLTVPQINPINILILGVFRPLASVLFCFCCFPPKSKEGNTVNWVVAQLLHTTVMFYYGKSLSVFTLFSNFHVQMFIHVLAKYFSQTLQHWQPSEELKQPILIIKMNF